MRIKEKERYKIVIGLLLIVIFIQWLFIAGRAPRVERPAKIKGRIAIVLDDWGYNLNNLKLAQQIKHPLTMSVLPNLRYSRQAAEELNNRGFEIILHLPLQPQGNLRLEKDTILVSMDERTIREILARDLDNISYARGVSNHMGSRVTEDPRVMRVIFEELKKRKFYFLDSRVSSDSVCPDLAHKMRLSFIGRDIFLDNSLSPEYIRGQVNKLKAKAKASGEAVGIGHDRRATLEVLKEMMPQIEKEGYKFVFVSDLVG